jgi:hypothetical protein
LILIHIDTVLKHQILKLAFTGLVADRAIQGMMFQQASESFPPQVQDALGTGGNRCPINRRRGACLHRLIIATDLDHTQPAGPYWIQSLVVTESRNGDTGSLCSFKDGTIFFGHNFSAVDR